LIRAEINADKQAKAFGLYLLLASLFVTALVVCNLIANKFVTVDLGFKTFIVSAGILPYPITFLITDLLSEIYGKKKTDQVVFVGLAASIFVLFLLWLGNQFSAIDLSPVSDEQYTAVFQNSKKVIFASMLAYLSAQFVDIRLYHFWKNLTKGKHLWIRNNFSTILSQLLDTTLVVGILFIGSLSNETILEMIRDGWLFKVICALIDTPVIYLAVYAIRRYFHISPNEELAI
jgi:queuosine precursor transporter